VIAEGPQDIVRVANGSNSPLFNAFRMVLVDKIALLIAFLIAAAMCLFWILGLVGLGGLPHSRFDHAMLVWAIETELALVVPIWLFLRAIDALVRISNKRSRSYRRVLRS